MFEFDFSLMQWVLLVICAVFVGMSKVGIAGISMFYIPVLALIFGGKPSTGILLPMLMMADIFGVAYYHRHTEWKYLFKLLPWAFVGIGIGLWAGRVVNDEWFKNIIAFLVFAGVGTMLWREKQKGTDFFPHTWWFAAIMGVLGGFATMIGNVAGPIFAIYMLAMNLPKNAFIGTGAWFFLIVNFSKFPLQVWVWNNIGWKTIIIDLIMLPAIALGAFLGIWIVRKIPDKAYRTFIIIVTVLSAFLLLI
ncbi:MAG: hypothetical protein FD181_508 [Prolixibacteraceae bacterium]|nr:MAG: hypothetical protein FD181_508 [Prolixibacteraceae bacterium]